MTTTSSHTENSIVDLPSLGLLKISGEGAKKLLQGQLTCDLEEITPTQSRLAAHCNPQGRVISFSRLFIFRENYYLQMPIETVPIAFTALKKYAVFFKLTLTDASKELSCIGYCGDQLKTIFSSLPQQSDEAITMEEFIVIKLLGEKNRYEIIGDPLAIAALKEKILASAKIVAPSVWKSLDIHAMIPAIYPETSEKFLPHDMNLHELNSISFNKGCYTGQEIIARMHYRGKLKNHLCRVTITTDTPPIRGADVFCENGKCGIIVDYCQQDLQHYQLLTILPKTV